MPRAWVESRLRPHIGAAVPGLLVVSLMLVWAVHDGGFDEDTWYWGALLMLALAVLLVVGYRRPGLAVSRPLRWALGCFALYVAWSYLSITWAQTPGVALEGSNRALLYLLVFAVMAALPWTPEAALAALLTWVIGVGVIAIVLLIRIGAGSDVSALFVEGRLAAPTGYINSTAALFTMQALPAIAIAARRGLPAPLRGLLMALAAASLQMALIVQSRGWLFTLPLVALVAVIVVKDRVRVAVVALIPVLAVLAPARRLLHIYQISNATALDRAAAHGGRPALMACAAAFAAGTLLAWADQLRRGRGLSRRQHRAAGTVAATVALAGAVLAALVVSQGHPVRLIVRQWDGFSREQTVATTSHFTDVGSGRYDFWRVALDAFLSHPIGGLGQDNFADYYITRRRTVEEPEWTHSLELRLLAHTGAVGFGLFAAFLVGALIAAAQGRRRAGPLARTVTGAALLPLIVWLIHGSVDWFWEMPAMSGPALGFLGMAGALAPAPAPSGVPASGRPRLSIPEGVWALAGAAAALAALVALAFPYLSVREVSLAGDVAATNPAAALRDLKTASRLNPLDSNPGRVAGAIALQNGEYAVALQRFRQSTQREPGGWFAWLGAGLAASALGDREAARQDFVTAHSINKIEPAVSEALRRVDSAHPLTSAQAFSLLAVVG